MKPPRPLLAGAALLAAAGLAVPLALPGHAQGTPNMVGTWRGQSLAVFLGTTPYRPRQGEGAQFASETLEFTYRVDRQEGNRFIGSVSSGARRETMIGAISTDNRTGVMLDDDGRSSFTLRSADVMDICYAHSLPDNRAVTCFTLTRTR